MSVVECARDACRRGSSRQEAELGMAKCAKAGGDGFWGWLGENTQGVKRGLRRGGAGGGGGRGAV